MKEIGGYFQLELPFIDNMPNKNGILLNSGRNALEYVLLSIGKIKKIHIPRYTCNVVMEPINKLNIEYSFYDINEELELSYTTPLSNGEYIIYTNYFGIKDTYVAKLHSIYGNKLIVDNAQALFATPTPKSIYSPRKFVGIPDGGIAFSDCDIAKEFPDDISFERSTHLLIRHDIGASAGYKAFKENSHKLCDKDICHMSKLTRRLITSINFATIKEQRIKNFQHLHKRLKESNKLNIDDWGAFECPLVYPYYTNDPSLKKKLIENKIFVATYWPNVMEWCQPDTIEYDLADKIIAIPIDQRYGAEDMEHIINIIIK